MAKNYSKVLCARDNVVPFLSGEEPVPSPPGVMNNIRKRTGRCKRRLLVDNKQPAISTATPRQFKGLNPVAVVLGHDALDLGDDLSAVETVWLLTFDNIDAFWLLPLVQVEGLFFVAKFKNLFYDWLRTAPDSRCAPFTFHAFGALLTRLTASLT